MLQDLVLQDKWLWAQVKKLRDEVEGNNGSSGDTTIPLSKILMYIGSFTLPSLGNGISTQIAENVTTDNYGVYLLTDQVGNAFFFKIGKNTTQGDTNPNAITKGTAVVGANSICNISIGSNGRLAIVTLGASAWNNFVTNSTKVYLYSFTDTPFTLLQQSSIVGVTAGSDDYTSDTVGDYPQVVSVPAISGKFTAAQCGAASGEVDYNIKFTLVYYSANVFQFVIYGDIENSLQDSSGNGVVFGGASISSIPEFVTEFTSTAYPDILNAFAAKYPTTYDQIFIGNSSATDLSYYHFRIYNGGSNLQLILDNGTSIQPSTMVTFHIPFTFTLNS